MGFMGLSSWIESDEAAGFRFTLQQMFEKFGKSPAKLKLAIRKETSRELKNMANAYNTPGFVNLALVLEDEGDKGNPKYEDPGLPVFSTILTLTQLRRADQLFEREIPRWDLGHRNRLQQLHRLIQKLIKDRAKS
jgi:hypothetical protein